MLLIPSFYKHMPCCIGWTMAGEIKDVKKSQLLGGPCHNSSRTLSAVLAYLFIRTIDIQFWYAIGRLWWTGEYSLAIPPYFPSFVGLLTNQVYFMQWWALNPWRNDWRWWNDQVNRACVCWLYLNCKVGFVFCRVCYVRFNECSFSFYAGFTFSTMFWAIKIT